MEIGQYTINQILSEDPQLFSMPQNAAEQINLVALGASQTTTASNFSGPPNYSGPPNDGGQGFGRSPAAGPSTPLPPLSGSESPWDRPGSLELPPRSASAAYAPQQNYGPGLRDGQRR